MSPMLPRVNRALHEMNEKWAPDIRSPLSANLPSYSGMFLWWLARAGAAASAAAMVLRVLAGSIT